MLLCIFLMLSLSLIFVSLATPPKEQANAYLTGFNPENIISDMAMTDTSTMDTNSVQQFLNARVPVCDTNGDKPYGGMTRRDYARATWGVSPPFTCLKNYVEGGRSAAQIIVDAGRANGINPQVLLVLLQKEQGLVTDDWPTSIEYQKATGFGCPDTAACDNRYSGFTNQVNNAASSFRSIMNGARSNYPAGQVNFVRYNPDQNCGGSNLFIRNRATSALYHYTPYQPNAAALAAGRAAAPPCGAYGNRNFFNYFTDWFGSTQKPLPGCDSRVAGVACVWELRAPTGEMFYTASLEERNNISYNAGFTYVGLAFYARTSPGDGMIPAYRLNNVGRQGYHFITTNAGEKDHLVSGGATLEGVAFYVDNAYNANTNYKTYRLVGPSGHVFTTSATRSAQLQAGGYTLKGVGFYSASGMGATPAAPTDKVNIYRLNLPGNHFYTTSVSERDNVIRSGSPYEGVGFYGSLTDTSTPVYRFNLGNEHFYTISAPERDALVRAGKSYEGVAWNLDKSTPLYRMVGPEHFYTTSLAEAAAISHVFRLEGIYAPFPTDNTPVYRVNIPGEHFYTANLTEALNASRAGKLEGIGWFTDNTSSGTPVYRFNLWGDHFYTASTAEMEVLRNSGAPYEGIAFYTANDSSRPAVYSLINGSEHFYTTSTSERDNVVRAGGRLEGARFYAK
jgi:hypothetical protein